MVQNIYETKIWVTEFDEAALEEGAAVKTKIMKYTLSNDNMEVDIIDYGATITAIRVPDRHGKKADVVLGYDSMSGYMAASNNPYFGATIGRVANRIANGKITIDDITYALSQNEGDNTLHGGVVGFNRRLWKGCIDEEGLSLRMISPHLDQGFPGELSVEAKFILTKDNNLVIRYKAKSDRPTVVNMTNHTYFNLAGHGSGADKLYEHELMISANHFTPTDNNNIPKGKLQDVFDTVLDFTKPKNIGEAIESAGDASGFDFNYCVLGNLNEKRFVARLEHPCTGRRLEMHSNQPGVQLYTSNCLQVKEGRGKEGVGYSKHSALCLETQNYPNAINVKHFPVSLLEPPNVYLHVVSYKFSTFDIEETVERTVSAGTVVNENEVQEEAPSDGSAGKPEREESKQEKVCAKPVGQKFEPLNCEKSVFPDFTLDFSERKDPDNEYEPISSIFPDEKQSVQFENFNAVLNQCKHLAAAASRPNIINSFSLCRNDHKYFDIVQDTDLSPTR